MWAGSNAACLPSLLEPTALGDPLGAAAARAASEAADVAVADEASGVGVEVDWEAEAGVAAPPGRGKPTWPVVSFGPSDDDDAVVVGAELPGAAAGLGDEAVVDEGPAPLMDPAAIAPAAAPLAGALVVAPVVVGVTWVPDPCCLSVAVSFCPCPKPRTSLTLSMMPSIAMRCTCNQYCLYAFACGSCPRASGVPLLSASRWNATNDSPAMAANPAKMARGEVEDGRLRGRYCGG